MDNQSVVGASAAMLRHHCSSCQHSQQDSEASIDEGEVLSVALSSDKGAHSDFTSAADPKKRDKKANKKQAVKLIRPTLLLVNYTEEDLKKEIDEIVNLDSKVKE